jgi:hypothetical protein
MISSRASAIHEVTLFADLAVEITVGAGYVTIGSDPGLAVHAIAGSDDTALEMVRDFFARAITEIDRHHGHDGGPIGTARHHSG